MLKLSWNLRGYALVLAVLCAAGVASPAIGSFATFESGQVRPLALSPDGNRLFAVNTPDGQLEIFSVSGVGLTHIESVPVGLEPVAVAARSDSEVWVVNHLSDSVSIVDVSSSPARVVRTLLVGDEPRDIVFAGDTDINGDFTRAFITTARRGQNVPSSGPNTVLPLLTTEGTPRALVWVFDTTNLGTTLEGVPEKIIELFGDTPRALAATADGSTVYAAVFHSGNQTTALSEGSVCNGGSGAAACNIPGDGASVPGGLPAPNQNFQGTTGPEVGLIVKFNENTGNWEDELSRDWSNAVRFNLPDLDVFEIDADAATPVEVDSFAHVGTVLFNMLVNPNNGNVYVSNTEARNEVRFEGPGNSASTVQGHLHEARITVINGANVLPRHLNKHINYAVVPSPLGVKDDSLATPTEMALASDGTLYVTAFGSSKVGFFSSSDIDNDTFTPDSANHIELTGGGPSGLVLDEANDRLYVLTRFDNSIKVVNTMTKAEVAQHSLHNPEPAEVVDGRPFLYDARFTSSNGEASCSSCHVFGDFDSLGWDLGNPDDVVATNPNPGPGGGIIFGAQNFHPMKGPMTTQTLRGMANHGPMHWRGDRTGGYVGQALNEQLAFEAFNVAFAGLVGRTGPIPAADMTAFAEFILEVVLPPNPIRNLNNQLTAAQGSARSIYLTRGGIDALATCNGCHELDPSQGFFGANGTSTFENETQEFKVAHLSNAYQKVGMFGMPNVPFLNVTDNGHTGDQVRGFGFLHDGSIDTVFHFLRATVFIGFNNNTERRNMEDFIMAFDTTFAPIVGQQVTLTSTNAATVAGRIDLMIQRATTNFDLADNDGNQIAGVKECDLIVKGSVGGLQRGYLLDNTSGQFVPDRLLEAPIDDNDLRAEANTAGQELTYTCVPPGSGQRMGLDRDDDGFLDRDEIDAGTDPADAASYPGAPIDTSATARKMLIKNKDPDDESKNKIVMLAKDTSIGTPEPSSADDPRCGLSPSGTVKAIFNVSSIASGQSHDTNLPCQNWSLIGSASNPKGYRYKDKELDDGTAKVIVWKDGKLLKTVMQGKGPTNLDYDLQLGISQGTVAATLTSGASRVCVVCPPFNGKDGSDAKKFLGKNCAAPTSCP